MQKTIQDLGSCEQEAEDEEERDSLKTQTNNCWLEITALILDREDGAPAFPPKSFSVFCPTNVSKKQK